MRLLGQYGKGEWRIYDYLPTGGGVSACGCSVRRSSRRSSSAKHAAIFTITIAFAFRTAFIRHIPKGAVVELEMTARIQVAVWRRESGNQYLCSTEIQPKKRR